MVPAYVRSWGGGAQISLNYNTNQNPSPHLQCPGMFGSLVMADHSVLMVSLQEKVSVGDT
jgi:hypothetical protein